MGTAGPLSLQRPRSSQDYHYREGHPFPYSHALSEVATGQIVIVSTV